MAFAPWENFEALVQSLLKPATPAATNPLDVASVAEAPKPGAVPKAPNPMGSFFQRPGFGAMAKTAARGLGWAGTAPAAASAGLMAAAGGNPLEAADPFMFARAVGEGAANLMLPDSAREAAAQVGGVGGYIRGTGPLGLGEGARPPGPVAPPPVIPPPNAAELALQARENARDASVTAPYASPDAQAYIAAQQEQSRVASATTLPALDTLVGRGGSMEDTNRRIQNIMANPRAIEQFNTAQGLNRSGILLSRDANGRPLFTADPNAQPTFYQGADGQPTRDWTKTEAYQSAIARNAADKAQLADIEAKREQADALGAVQKAKTVAGKKIAAELYVAGLQNQVARTTAGNTATAAGQKAQNDQAKLAVDYMLAQATGDEKATNAAKNRLLMGAAAMTASGNPMGEKIASTLFGRAGDQNAFTAVPGMDPKVVDVLNRGTGGMRRVTPTVVVPQADFDAARRKYPNKTIPEIIQGFKSQGLDTSDLRW